MSKDIFEASRNGDIDFVKSALSQGVDLNQKDEYGFTALHCAAMGSNNTEKEINLEITKILVEAGSDIEALGSQGRTALFLFAEFSPHLDQLELLIDKGAKAEVFDEYGNHITENAMTEESISFLSKLTNRKIEKDTNPTRESINLKAKDWRKANKELSKVFTKLNNLGLIAVQNIGDTQSDAFEDCSEEYHKRKNKSNIKGFCFYTNQDTERAKSFGTLPVGIWGATEGGESETIEVGKIVTEVLNEYGFDVDWDGTSTSRPEISLHRFHSSKGLFGIFRK